MGGVFYTLSETIRNKMNNGMIFADCSSYLNAQTPALVSLALAGLLGSITHCSVMCSALTASQLIEMKINHQATRLIAAYHAGRIVTYSLLGVAAMLAAQWLFSAASQSWMRGILFLAGIMFVISALHPRQTHACCSHSLQGLLRRAATLRQPHAIYVLRGLLMGFMPCGLLVAALLLAATLPTPWHAALGMTLFGLATTPMLQLAGLGALRLSNHYPHTARIAGRGAMTLNGLLLCALGMQWIRIA